MSKDDAKKKAAASDQAADLDNKESVVNAEAVDHEDLEEKIGDDQAADQDKKDSDANAKAVGKKDMKKKADDEALSDKQPTAAGNRISSRGNRKKFFANHLFETISLAVILIAAVVLVLFGPAPTQENVGSQVYSATVAEYFPITRLDELYDIVKEVVGQSADVRMDVTLPNGNSQVLMISLKPTAAFPEAALTERLNDAFPYLKLSYFEYTFYQPVLTWNVAAAVACVFALYLIVLFLIVGLMFNGRSGLIAVLMLLLDLLLVISLYVLLRLPNPRLLIAAGIIMCFLSPYFVILKLATLEKHSSSIKTRRNVEAFWALVNNEKRRSLDLVVVAGLLLVAFLVVGLIMKVALLPWIGVSVAATLLVALYSSNLILPKFWGKLNPFVIKEPAKTKKG